MAAHVLLLLMLDGGAQVDRGQSPGVVALRLISDRPGQVLPLPGAETARLERTEVVPALPREVDVADPASASGGAAPAARTTSSTGESTHVERGSESAGLLFSSRYYREDELTAKPRVISDAETAKPVQIPDIHPMPVLVRILISARGTVDQVILGENFLSAEARDHIVESIAAMRFSPGMIGALAVRSEFQVIVELDAAMPLQ